MNDDKISLTVLTLTLNSEPYLRQCLASVEHAIRQAEPFGIPITQVCVDGGSIDNTLSIIKQSRATLVSSPEMGIYKSIDFALTQINSSHVCYVHSDDLIEPDFFAAHFRYLTTASTLSITASNIRFIDSNGKLLWDRTQPRVVPILQSQVNLVLHPNCIYPLCFERKYPYCLDIEMGNAADWVHINRLIGSGVRIVRVGSRYKFRIHAKSTTISTGKAACRRYAFFFSLFSSTSFFRIPALFYLLIHENNIVVRIFHYLRGKRHFT
jgi:glycosyltransferase involved in cell wall biosynthesis